MRRIMPLCFYLAALLLWPLCTHAQEIATAPVNTVPLVVPAGAEAGPDFDIDAPHAGLYRNFIDRAARAIGCVF